MILKPGVPECTSACLHRVQPFMCLVYMWAPQIRLSRSRTAASWSVDGGGLAALPSPPEHIPSRPEQIRHPSESFCSDAKGIMPSDKQCQGLFHLCEGRGRRVSCVTLPPPALGVGVASGEGSVPSSLPLLLPLIFH